MTRLYTIALVHPSNSDGPQYLSIEQTFLGAFPPLFRTHQEAADFMAAQDYWQSRFQIVELLLP